MICMNSSFDRLFNLAQKTGNNLIVYDRHGDQHFVIMDIDEYENILDIDSSDPVGPVDHLNAAEDVSDELSDAQLFEKINHDIAVWRARHEQAESQSRENELAKELSEDTFDPFIEDHTHNDSWHRAGEVLQKFTERMPAPSSVNSEIDQAASLVTPSIQEPVIQPLSQDTPTLIASPTQPVPFLPHEELETEAGEGLDDEEPIFFEEPVE